MSILESSAQERGGVMTTQSIKQKHIVFQAAWLLITRPMDFLSTLREFFLFTTAWALRQVIPFWGGRVELGKNVRIQKNRSLRVEAPAAQLSIGDDSIIYENALLEAFGEGRIEVGEQSVLGDIRISCRARIKLGKRCLSSWNVFLQDFDPHPLEQALRAKQVSQLVTHFRPSFVRQVSTAEQPEPFEWEYPKADIVIGDDVWLGANVTILKGAHIGSGSIVAAGAVVVRGTYPERSLLAGNPARVIREVNAS